METSFGRRSLKTLGVFTREEIKALLSGLEDEKRIMGNLLYGAGLRLMECIRLRIKDVDFGYRQILVRDWKRRD